MIDMVKEVEPEIGYRAIMQVSETEAAMREPTASQDEDRLHLLRCRLHLRDMDERAAHPEGGTDARSGEWHLHLREGQVRLGLREHPDRLTKPLIREGEDFREASWHEALSLVARRLGEIKAANGPDSIGVIASSKCTNEDGFLMQKFARAVIGTNNIGQLLALLPVAGDGRAVAHRWLWRRLRLHRGYREGRAGHHHRQQHGGVPSGAGDAREARAQAARPTADRERSA